jgi:hypothetical protein
MSAVLLRWFHFLRSPKGHPYLIYFFFLSLTAGTSFALFSDYIYKEAANPDLDTYLGLSHFDFDQSPIRRYRVIVPFLAAGLHALLHPILNLMQPQHFPGPDFSMGFCFLIINNLIMAGAFLMIYELGKSLGMQSRFALLSVLFIITCRWTLYVCGLPLVDSLYFFILTATLYAITTQNIRWTYAVMLLGPWAKESFIFVAPMLFFYGPIPKLKQIPIWILSGALIFAFRYGYDQWAQWPVEESLQRDVAHLGFIGDSLHRLFSFHGVYEIASIVGLGGMSFLLLLHPAIRRQWKSGVQTFQWIYLLIILWHALLSTDLARMLYLMMPVLALWMGQLMQLGYSFREK